MRQRIDLGRIKAICFDLDGTIADTDDVYVLRIMRILRPMNPVMPGVDPESLARWIVMGVEAPLNLILTLIHRLQLRKILSPLVRALQRNTRMHAQLIPGARQALISLRAKYPLGIVTARDGKGTLEFLRSTSMEHLFESVVTSHTCMRGKPHPEPILWSAHELGTRPEHIMMVGDTTVDIRAAKSAGAQSAGVLSGFGRRDELERAGADIVVQDILELAGLILPT